MPTKISSTDTVEMVDGRVYLTTDNWQTIFMKQRGDDRIRRVPAKQLDFVRFLAVAQSSAGPS
jgi:hypothetical protein